MDKNKNKKSLKKVSECENCCFVTEILLHQKQENDKNSLVLDFNEKYTVEFVSKISIENESFEFKSVCKKRGLNLIDALRILSDIVNRKSVDLEEKKWYSLDENEEIIYLKISEDEEKKANVG